jgi:hypothetical protein
MINRISQMPNSYEKLLIKEFILNPLKFIVLKKEYDKMINK